MGRTNRASVHPRGTLALVYLAVGAVLTPTVKRYAILKRGYAVLGMGSSRREAIDDASDVLQWWGVAIDSQAWPGDINIVQCSERCETLFREEGGVVALHALVRELTDFAAIER